MAYAPRCMCVRSALAASGLGVSWWFIGQEGDWRLMRYVPCVYFPWLGISLWFYRQRRRDIVPLAVAALSAIAVVTAGLVKGLFDNRHFGTAALFMVAALVAAMTAGAAVWLRPTTDHWNNAAPAGSADDA